MHNFKLYIYIFYKDFNSNKHYINKIIYILVHSKYKLRPIQANNR